MSDDLSGLDLLALSVAMFGIGVIVTANWYDMKARDVREQGITETRIRCGPDVFCNYNAAQFRAVCDRPYGTANEQSWYARGK